MPDRETVYCSERCRERSGSAFLSRARQHADDKKYLTELDVFGERRRWPARPSLSRRESTCGQQFCTILIDTKRLSGTLTR